MKKLWISVKPNFLTSTIEEAHLTSLGIRSDFFDNALYFHSSLRGGDHFIRNFPIGKGKGHKTYGFFGCLNQFREAVKWMVFGREVNLNVCVIHLQLVCCTWRRFWSKFMPLKHFIEFIFIEL